jgi:hypothetical protein
MAFYSRRRIRRATGSNKALKRRFISTLSGASELVPFPIFLSGFFSHN